MCELKLKKLGTVICRSADCTCKTKLYKHSNLRPSKCMHTYTQHAAYDIQCKVGLHSEVTVKLDNNMLSQNGRTCTIQKARCRSSIWLPDMMTVASMCMHALQLDKHYDCSSLLVLTGHGSVITYAFSSYQFQPSLRAKSCT